MRLTSAILAILVLVLSCLPCDDIGATSFAYLEQSNAQNIPPVEHSDNHNDIDLCSPFCHCACCAGFSIIYHPVVLPEHTHTTASSQHADFLSAEVIEISLPIWQPPQLA